MEIPEAIPSSQPLAGRVVRLHFQCYAEIPIGSFLRVTGSTLWAPGTAASDPSDTAHASQHMADQENSGGINNSDTNSGFNHMDINSDMNGPSTGTLYASSVEMVTTPEDYPIWRTRKPVVIVINSNRHRSKTVQHHYYRYLVVSPGGSCALLSQNGNPQMFHTGGVPGHVAPSPTIDDTEDAFLVSTSSEMSGSTAVMQWEDPFGSLGRQHGNTTFALKQLHKNSAGGSTNSYGPDVTSASAVSLNSTVTLGDGQFTSMDYRNLPYRIIDIDVQMGRPLYEEHDEINTTVRIDRWNNPDDASFQPYLIREAVSGETVLINYSFYFVLSFY